ncbi:hypothetical protein D3C87_1458170 [compost metagenome]
MPFEHQFRFVGRDADFWHSAEAYRLRLRKAIVKADFQKIEVACAGASDEDRHMAVQAEQT